MRASKSPITSLAEPHACQLSVPSPPAQGDFRHSQVHRSLVQRHEPLVNHALSVSHLIIHAMSSGQQVGAKALLVALARILHCVKLLCELVALVGIITDAALGTRIDPRWGAEETCPTMHVQMSAAPIPLN